MRAATAFSIGVRSRSSASSATAAGWGAAGWVGFAGAEPTPSINRSTSAFTTRPSGPLPRPASCVRSMPAWSAIRRAIGDTLSVAVPPPDPLVAAAGALDVALLRLAAGFASGSGLA